MPVAQIALTSGFRSLRRFNAAFLGGYRMNPTRLRRAAPRIASDSPQAARGRGSTRALAGDAITLNLAYRAPYDVAALLAFVAQRAIPGVETIAGRSIRRTERADVLGASPGWLEARFATGADRVQLSFAPSLAAASGAVIAAVRRWLDLDAAPATIAETLVGLPGEPGLRLPGSVDAFELAVRAVLGQQVTVAAARTLARRLTERFGAPLATPWPEIDRTFPGPADLAVVPVERIAELGIIRNRAVAIQALASHWDALVPLFVPGAPPETLVERLCALPGIGPWTAHYVAMRGLGWPDAFPPGDVAALKAMRQLFTSASTRDAMVHAERWRPWRAYALLRLWNSLGATP
jgi:AraC family transcriptional regulator of adaptative response / DNA-3-methyladenine glycosylase II